MGSNCLPNISNGLCSPEFIKKSHSISYRTWGCMSCEIVLQVSFLAPQFFFLLPPHCAPLLCVAGRDHSELRRLQEGEWSTAVSGKLLHPQSAQLQPDPPAVRACRPAAGWVPSRLFLFLDANLCSPTSNQFLLSISR